MAAPTKDHDRRERLREYDAALAGARAPVEVLALFVTGREARAHSTALEEEFAATAVSDDERRLPAAVWVALRQGDIETAIDTLVRLSRNELVIAAHEELDAGYRLTTVEERRTLPDVDLLEAQLAAFLGVPRDVVAIISAWGPGDPRSTAEIDTLLEYRFGPLTGRPAAGPVDDRAQRLWVPPPRDGSRAGLVMSSTELVAMLDLTPEQRAVLGTLVRQADITIVAGDDQT